MDNPEQDNKITFAPLEGEGQTIDLSQLTPINDPDCEHEFVREDEPDIPGTYTEMCVKCPVGRIVRA